MQRILHRDGRLTALLLIVAYVSTAYFSLEYLGGPDGRTALYVSNAFLISGLVLLTGRWRIVCLLGSVIGCAGLFPAGGKRTISVPTL